MMPNMPNRKLCLFFLGAGQLHLIICLVDIVKYDNVNYVVKVGLAGPGGELTTYTGFLSWLPSDPDTEVNISLCEVVGDERICKQYPVSKAILKLKMGVGYQIDVVVKDSELYPPKRHFDNSAFLRDLMVALENGQQLPTSSSDSGFDFIIAQVKEL